MTTLNRPPWKHSSVELLIKINQELANRLNSDPQQDYLWAIDPTQFQLSRPGALSITWSIIGGPIRRGWQAYGPDQPAKCVAARLCRLQAEIRTIEPKSVGFTADDMLLAEEVLRQIVIVMNKLYPADYDEDEQEEQWTGFTDDPGQRQIVCQYRVTPVLLVHGDPFLFKTITSIEDHGEITSS